MTFFARGIIALAFAAAVAGSVQAQDKPALDSERDKVSYMIGLDVGKSIEAAGPDVDLQAFERALRNAMEGGQPLVAEDKVKPLAESLMARIASRAGKLPAGTPVPTVARDQVGFLIGADVGRQLAPIAAEIELPLLVEGVRTILANAAPALPEAEANALRAKFAQRMQAQGEAKAAAEGAKNKAEGDAFLAKNRLVKGVFTTGSGLQYMVLRQGNGPRPGPANAVEVNYRGTLLDGTEFDSSYSRGQPATFSLSQVVAGWTEGLGLMPVGSKYRFWIPSELGYGARGTPGGPIGPNETLMFDVELLSIQP
ncbi:MAG: FKBP-type peptidyl-prolyl cis-trans isomerase [Pseudomonadota bacterium]|nr:FKBP-type peptidyl-prolyl cis-trans isomerase [Pseudomonadota bacterium]